MNAFPRIRVELCDVSPFVYLNYDTSVLLAAFKRHSLYMARERVQLIDGIECAIIFESQSLFQSDINLIPGFKGNPAIKLSLY